MFPARRAAAVGPMIRLLLVEDSPTDALLIEDGLASAFPAPPEVTTAGCLADGLRALATRSFDLAILDLNLPDSNGIATLRRVRETAPDVPVVTLSGQTSDTLTREMLAAGAIDCLPKGLNAAILARSIRFAAERLAIMAALRQRSRELAESRERLRTLINVHPDAAFVVGAEGNVLFVNAAGAAMFERTVKELVGQPFGLPLGNEQPVQVDVRRGAVSVVAEMRVVPVVWRGRQAHIAFLHDVTEQRAFAARLAALNEILEQRVTQRTREQQRTAETLTQRNQQIEAFYHMLSHELKTPLTAAREMVCLVLDGLAGAVTPPQHEYLQMARDSCDQMRRCLDDLVDASRLETGKLSLKIASASLADVAATAVRSVQPEFEARQVTIDEHICPDLVPVAIDRQRIVQVITNLLNNAAKCSARGQRVAITVTAMADTGHQRVSVRDHGPGIALDQQQRIFDRLYQIKMGDGATEQGMGLGLYLCRELVDLHGGTLGVDSTPGSGSTFWFDLPQPSAAATPARGAE